MFFNFFFFYISFHTVRAHCTPTFRPYRIYTVWTRIPCVTGIRERGSCAGKMCDNADPTIIINNDFSFLFRSIDRVCDGNDDGDYSRTPVAPRATRTRADDSWKRPVTRRFLKRPQTQKRRLRFAGGRQLGSSHRKSWSY